MVKGEGFSSKLFIEHEIYANFSMKLIKEMISEVSFTKYTLCNKETLDLLEKHGYMCHYIHILPL